MKGIFLVMVLVVVLDCGERQNGKSGEHSETKAVAGDRVEVLYFHSKQRCMTCRSIEQCMREVLEEHFGEAVKVGKVV